MVLQLHKKEKEEKKRRNMSKKLNSFATLIDNMARLENLSEESISNIARALKLCIIHDNPQEPDDLKTQYSLLFAIADLINRHILDARDIICRSKFFIGTIADIFEYFVKEKLQLSTLHTPFEKIIFIILVIIEKTSTLKEFLSAFSSTRLRRFVFSINECIIHDTMYPSQEMGLEILARIFHYLLDKDPSLVTFIGADLDPRIRSVLISNRKNIFSLLKDMRPFLSKLNKSSKNILSIPFNRIMYGEKRIGFHQDYCWVDFCKDCICIYDIVGEVGIRIPYNSIRNLIIFDAETCRVEIHLIQESSFDIFCTLGKNMEKTNTIIFEGIAEFATTKCQMLQTFCGNKLMATQYQSVSRESRRFISLDSFDSPSSLSFSSIAEVEYPSEKLSQTRASKRISSAKVVDSLAFLGGKRSNKKALGHIAGTHKAKQNMQISHKVRSSKVDTKRPEEFETKKGNTMLPKHIFQNISPSNTTAMDAEDRNNESSPNQICVKEVTEWEDDKASFSSFCSDHFSADKPLCKSVNDLLSAQIITQRYSSVANDSFGEDDSHILNSLLTEIAIIQHHREQSGGLKALKLSEKTARLQLENGFKQWYLFVKSFSDSSEQERILILHDIISFFEDGLAYLRQDSDFIETMCADMKIKQGSVISAIKKFDLLETSVILDKSNGIGEFRAAIERATLNAFH